MRSFDGRAEPVDSGREELVVAILNAFRTNMECVQWMVWMFVAGKALCPVIGAHGTYVTCDDVKSLSHVKMNPHSVDL